MAQPATIDQLADEARVAHKRAERASREAARASARLAEAMREFAREHPNVVVRTESRN